MPLFNISDGERVETDSFRKLIYFIQVIEGFSWVTK